MALAHSICMCPCADCTHIHVFLAPAHGNATFLFHMPIKYFTITYFITTYFTLTFKFMHMAPFTVTQFTCQEHGKFSSVLPAAMKLVQQVLFYALFFWSLKKARGAPKRHKAFKVEPEEGLITEAHQKNFAGHLLDICMGNRLSAHEGAELITQGRLGGIAIKGPFKLAEGPSKRKEAMLRLEKAKAKRKDKGPVNGNQARSLRRWMNHQHNWVPDLYWADVPIWDPKRNQKLVAKLPFLLPHEWLGDYLLQDGAFEEGLPQAGSWQAQALKEVCNAWGEPEEGMFPIGMHGDGVPVQGRMNQSTLDYFTINFPCSQTWQQERFLITCIETRWALGFETSQAIQKVIAWSLSCLGKGQWPAEGHDGKPLDKWRKTRAGKSLKKACLIAIRGDWDWFVKWYHAPNHNTKINMCWLCTCTPESWRRMGMDERILKSLKKASWLDCLKERKKPCSPLFDLPGVDNYTMKADWMHAVDEGIAATICGNVLAELEKLYPSLQKAERVAEMWADIRDLYQKFDVPPSSRLPKLSEKDIQKSGKQPELSGKAAHIRGLCPLLGDLAAAKLPAEGTPHQRAVRKLASYCSCMCQSLEKAELSRMVKYGRLLKSQWMALEDECLHLEDTLHWHSKPKLHLFDHIIDAAVQGVDPRDNWCYADETFGFSLQGLFYRRGGKKNAGMDAERVMLGWMAAQDFPGLQKADA